jgi:hypothetical protein
MNRPRLIGETVGVETNRIITLFFVLLQHQKEDKRKKKEQTTTYHAENSIKVDNIMIFISDLYLVKKNHFLSLKNYLII